MIISGGEKISVSEVESHLLEHEAIEDVVVVGVEDEKWGQRVEAVMKVKQGVDPPSNHELKRFLARRIGAYKIPKVYHLWSSIPETSTGKKRIDVIQALIQQEKRAQNRGHRGANSS